jgi:methionine biosynthesis protein MetW
MRIDHDVIMEWIAPGSRVLDLGCGDGTLLLNLQEHKNVKALGIEIDAEKFNRCLEKGLNVIDQNLDDGLGNFTDNSFDVVVMTQTLQAMHHPDKVLEETLRVGKQSIVAFPNFGHWTCRLHITSKGRMPVSKFMPYNWYDTPNIHFCTIRDFEALLAERRIKVLNRVVSSPSAKLGGLAKLWPNLFGSMAIYHLGK